MRDRHAVEAAEPDRPDNRRDHAFADVERRREAESAGIHEQRRAAGKYDERRVALSNVDERGVQMSIAGRCQKRSRIRDDPQPGSRRRTNAERIHAPQITWRCGSGALQLPAHDPGGQKRRVIDRHHECQRRRHAPGHDRREAHQIGGGD